MLNVVMLSVVAPSELLDWLQVRFLNILGLEPSKTDEAMKLD